MAGRPTVDAAADRGEGEAPCVRLETKGVKHREEGCEPERRARLPAARLGGGVQGGVVGLL